MSTVSWARATTSNRGSGPGEMGDSLAAVSLGTGRSATAVACGQSHSCVILDDGRLKCFGRSSSGELGLLTTFDRGDGPGEMGDFLPVVQLGSGVTAANVTLGQYFSCVTLSSGQLKCFGLNGFGQLGQGDCADARRRSWQHGRHLAVRGRGHGPVDRGHVARPGPLVRDPRRRAPQVLRV
jgi:E3 ubiquitin-protein ligase HERC3